MFRKSKKQMKQNNEKLKEELTVSEKKSKTELNADISETLID